MCCLDRCAVRFKAFFIPFQHSSLILLDAVSFKKYQQKHFLIFQTPSSKRRKKQEDLKRLFNAENLLSAVFEAPHFRLVIPAGL